MISKTAMPWWYFDTCASTHISNCKDQRIETLRPPSTKSSVAKSEVFVITEGVGDVRICWLGTGLVVNSMVVRDVLYVSEVSDLVYRGPSVLTEIKQMLCRLLYTLSARYCTTTAHAAKPLGFEGWCDSRLLGRALRATQRLNRIIIIIIITI